jgi:hypothetical protein
MQGRWAARAKGIEVQLLLILFSEMGLKCYIVSLPSAASPTVQTRPPYRWQLLIVLSTLPSITPLHHIWHTSHSLLHVCK